MTTTLLHVEGLGMAFSGQALLRGLSFSYEAGVVALTGENGAGKSTLLSLLAGVQAPQQGRIAVAGHDLARQPAAARRALAWAPDTPVAYDFQSGDEFLRMVAALRGERAQPVLPALLAGFGLEHHLWKRFEAMSLGTRKKFMLASSLASEARVLLLDEPTNGIDAAAKAFLVGEFARERTRRLFFFSTHDRETIAAARAEVFALPDPRPD